jgi:predicted nucleic acid-binding Zn ribbon protein
MVEKICRKEVQRAKIRIWKGLGAYLKDSRGSGETDL